MAYHSEDRPFTCSECGISFKNKLGLYHHNNTLHSGRPNRHKCKYCSREFKVKRDKARHELYIHRTPQGAKPFPCKYDCGLSYKRERSMRDHCRDSCPNRPYTAESGDEVEEAVVEAITNETASGSTNSNSTKPVVHPPKKIIRAFTCERNCGAKFKSRGISSRYYLHLQRWCPLRDKDKGNEESQSEHMIAEEPEESTETGEISENIEAENTMEEPSEMDLMNIIDQIQ